jgi:ABC-type transporter Mla MlaB component
VAISIWGPLRRGDLPGLYARVCALLAANAGAVIAADVTRCAADAVAVEALARLQLGARRYGCRVRLRRATPELIALVRFMGLAEVLPA